MTDTVDVAIVGAGVAGSSLAYALARRGLEVCLLDAGHGTVHGAGHRGEAGASTVPAALLNPHRGRTGRARADDLSGLRAFWALVERLEGEGRPTGAHRSGVLRVAASARQARLWQDTEGMRRLPAEEVPEQLHAPHGCFYVACGGWVEPGVLLPTLRTAAADRGAELRPPTAVEGIEGRVLHTSAGTLRARRIVLCIGAGAVSGLPLPAVRRVAGDALKLGWSGPVLPPLAGAVNAAFLPGAVWVTGGHADVPTGGDPHAEVAAGGDPHAVNPAGGDPHAVNPAGGDRHANPPQAGGPRGPVADDPQGAPADVTADVAEPLRAALAWSVPGLAGAPVLGRWHGVRARAAEPYPVVRQVAEGVTYYGALAGRGFLCAADLSERLADALAAGSPS